MSGAGSERPAVGFAVGALSEDDGAWVIERDRNGEWVEVERLGSEELARQRLDELAAEEDIPLGELRLREIRS